MAISNLPEQCIFRGDTPTLNFTLKDTKGKAINLLSTEVYFVMKKKDADITKDGQYTANRLVEIVEASKGKCRVQLTRAETQDAGKEIVELEIRDFDQEFQPESYSNPPSSFGTIPSSGISAPPGANLTNIITGARFQVKITEDIRKTQ